MVIPKDDSKQFPDIPLQGHICALSCDGKKHYWQVQRLIEEASVLVPFEKRVDELIDVLGNSSWYSTNERATIKSILAHIERAQNADLRFPLILSADGRMMDGSHRLLRAVLEGLTVVKVVQFESNPAPGYIEDLLDAAQ